MRWKALFDDMDSQFAGIESAASNSEIADRVRREQGSVALVDRLRAQIGFVLRVRVSGNLAFDGEVTHVGSEWLVLSKEAAEVLIPLGAIRTIEGVNRRVMGEVSRVERTLGLASAFRAMARDRAHVTVYQVEAGAHIQGVIDRVGADFVEIAAVPPGEQRRSTSVTGVYCIPFSAVAAVASR